MIAKLFQEQRPLMIAGLISFVCFVATLILSLADNTQILGINRWIKPMKFYISIVIFIWTIAVLLQYLPNKERFSRIMSWALIVIFVVEMAAVTGQAIRGVKSHFNFSSPQDGAIFAAMGLAIVINTIFVGVLTYHYFRSNIDLPPAIIWGIRLGLLLFLFGSIQGGYMSSQIGHTVGAADGGPGLPLTNWSTTAGDLRVAHFLGLHAIQVLPLLGIALERWLVPNRVVIVFGMAFLYFGFFLAVLVQALNGRPLIAIGQ
jgi:hypothetical protein